MKKFRAQFIENDDEKQATDFAIISSEFVLMMEQLFRMFGIKKEISVTEVTKSV